MRFGTSAFRFRRKPLDVTALKSLHNEIEDEVLSLAPDVEQVQVRVLRVGKKMTTIRVLMMEQNQVLRKTQFNLETSDFKNKIKNEDGKQELAKVILDKLRLSNSERE